MIRRWKPTPTDRFLAGHGESMGQEQQRALAWARLPKGADALDVGTGSGRTAWLLAAHGLRVVGVDSDPRALARARRRLAALPHRRRIRLRRADAGALPFASAAFGAAVCSAALHHMRHPLEALEELARVLSPRGRLLVIEINGHGAALLERAHQHRFGKAHDANGITPRRIRAWLRARFRTLREKELGMQTAWLAQGPVAERRRP